MTRQIDSPLSDSEIIELDDFLLSADEEEDERLSIDEAHGFLTALVVSRDPLLTHDEWMPMVWGEPAFADDEEKERMTALLLRLRRDVETNLQSSRDFEPLIVEQEEDGEIFVAHEGWCYGFMLAISHAEERWNSLPKNEQDLLMPIARLAMLQVEDDTEIDEEEYEMLAELIPGAVVSLYRYWQTH